MKALVLTAYNSLTWADWPEPEYAENEVLVRVKACGICGSDVHGLDGSTGRRIPPLVMGHEASGVVEAVGDKVTKWKPGDRVTFDSTIYRLDDWFTRKGHYNLSDHREVLGVSPGTYRRHGAFAEMVAVPEHIVYRLPHEVSFEQAALVEPVAVALHALSLSGLQPGDSCLVTGAGIIGLSLLQAAQVAGAMPVVISDIDHLRLELAKELGANHTLNVSANNNDNWLNKLTGGRGFDVAFEAVGLSETVNDTIERVRKGGKVVLVGNIAKTIEFPLQSVVTREVAVLGSCAINGEYEAALKLIAAGSIKVDRMISAVAPMREGAIWFDRLTRKEPGLNKVILVP